MSRGAVLASYGTGTPLPPSAGGSHLPRVSEGPSLRAERSSSGLGGRRASSGAVAAAESDIDDDDDFFDTRDDFSVYSTDNDE